MFLDWLFRRSGKRPIRLYRLTADGVEYRLAGIPRGTITVGGEVWTAAHVTTTNFRETGALSRAEGKMMMASSQPFAQLFKGGAPNKATVEISKFFAEDPDEEVVRTFKGRITSFQFFPLTAAFFCQSRFTDPARGTHARPISRFCTYAHYGPLCGLDVNDFLAAYTATAWNDPVLTVSGISSLGDGEFTGGQLHYGGGMIPILNHVGDALTLRRLPAGLADEITANGFASVSLAPGCNRHLVRCRTRYDNLANYPGKWDLEGVDLYDGRNPFS